jgi:hypothetical protein
VPDGGDVGRLADDTAIQLVDLRLLGVNKSHIVLSYKVTNKTIGFP